MVSMFVISALLALLASCAPFSARPLPDIRGRMVLDPGPQRAVRITRDRAGVPHIEAATRSDAYFAQGYVHAQDRFFQMEFWRRIGQGRLAELFGETVLASDVYLRTVGFYRVAEAEYEQAPPWLKGALEAYAAGVNAYIAEKKPGQLSYEFILLDLQGVELEIEPWSPPDTLVWGKVMSQDLAADLSNELLRLNILQSVGINGAKELFRPYRYDEMPTILQAGEWPVPGSDVADVRPLRRREEELPIPDPTASAEGQRAWWERDRRAWARALEFLPNDRPVSVLPGFYQIQELTLGGGAAVGSNGWVVSGEHTASGYPILANDPHLAVQMPPIFYQVLLSYTSPAGFPVRLRGFSFPGVPGVIIGHNQEVAWGITNAFVDEQDLYTERINPQDTDEYLADGEWRQLDQRIETIAVHGREDALRIRVRSTRNGPIITDNGGYIRYPGFRAEPTEVLPETMELTELSLKWLALDPGTSFASLIRLNEARSFDEFRDALRHWRGPTQNFVYADRAGTIAYQLAGPAPLRGAGSGSLPAPGWDEEFQWRGVVPFDDLPYTVNPDRGYIVTANNAWVGGSYPYFLGRNYLAGYRARRITELLRRQMAAGEAGADSMQDIQLDTYDVSADEVLAAVAAIPLEGFDLGPPADETSRSEKSAVGNSADRLAAGESVGRRAADQGAAADDFSSEAARRAAGLLADWDRRITGESAGAALYVRFFVELTNRIYGDEIAHDYWEAGAPIKSTARIQSSIDLLLSRPESEWWDDVLTTDRRESRDEVLVRSLSAAFLDLSERLGDDPSRWRWNDLHALTYRHQSLGSSGVRIVERLFNRGPFPADGGLNQVARNAVRLYAPETVAFTTAARTVLDLADWSTGLWGIAGGQSGHIRSRRYDDGIDPWLDGELSTRAWTEEEIRGIRGARMILEPAQ
jgi:penicillin amidase